MKDSMIPAETIQKAIYLLRGQNVILDRDLAAMYGVPTKALKQAVKRNAHYVFPLISCLSFLGKNLPLGGHNL